MTTRIAIAGLGAIGRALATRIAKGTIPGTSLACVAARDEAKARAFLDGEGIDAPVEITFEVERGVGLGSASSPANCQFVEQRSIVCRRQQ